MGQLSKEALEGATVVCDGCRRKAFVLRVVDDAKLCDVCVEKSERIDRQLAEVRADDPVSCDGCRVLVDFDARIAVVARECGGSVLWDDCKPVAAAIVIGARA